MALESHFFTDLSKVADSQSSQNAFGPIGSTDQEKEKKFNLTNVFSKKSGVSDQPPAIAVTNGVLFIVPQNPDNTGHPITLVNIFLKPDKAIDLGVKIKYFVYRSVKIESLFIDDGIGNYKALQQTDGNLLPFFAKIWQEYLEFNPSLTGSDVFDAKKVGFNTTELKSYQDFFKEGDYNFPKITGGKTIGFFANDFGFEVVVDEGDFVQEHSDTGFEFKDDFFRAKQCILNLNLEAANKNPSNIYGNLPTNVGEKVFRESIYLFLDPAAFYGMHATTSIKGKVKVGSSAYTTTSQIATNILHKFLNKTKTYLYIKSTRGRSYGFYDGTKNIKYENVSTYSAFSPSTQPKSFEDNKWPLIIDSSFDQGTLILSLENIENKQNAIFVHNFNSNSPNNFFNENWLGTNPETTRVGIIGLPKTGSTVNANFIVCTYQDISNFNEIFGRVNLIAIFEKEDFETTSNDVSFVDHLRPVLIKDEDDLGLYHTKVVLDGAYISNTIPTGSSTNDDLRTYILFPQKSTKQKTGISLNTSVTAGYYTKDENKSNDYIRQIYGGGEIWRGLIVDTISGSTVNIKSLLYRRKDNDDEMPIYQLGISHNEFEFLKGKVNVIDANATNLFFNLEKDTSSNAPSFIKYKLRISFDKINGTTGITPNNPTDFISLYTIDGYFFFTKGYSDKFEHYNEFGEITADFLPRENYNGEFGFDWFRKGDLESSSNIMDRKFNEIITQQYKKNTNELETNVNFKGGDFKFDKNKYLKLKNREYCFLPVKWKLSSENTSYEKDNMLCFLSIYRTDNNYRAKLRVQLRFLNSPSDYSEISIQYNKNYFTIRNTDDSHLPDNNPNVNELYKKLKIPINNQQPNKFFVNIEIENYADLPIDELVTVNALKKDGTNTICGRLIVKANDRINRNVTRVLLLQVLDKFENLNGTFIDVTSTIKEKNDVRRFLNQSLIDPIFIESFKINVRNDSNFEPFKSYDALLSTPESRNGIDFRPPNSDFSLYIKNKIDSAIMSLGESPDKYRNYFKVVYFSRNSHTYPPISQGMGVTQAFTNSEQKIIVVSNEFDNGTVPHEVLHSLNIAHTFTNQIADRDALYTYTYKQTDNLMDYDIQRKTTYHWQWKRAKTSESVTIEPPNYVQQ